MNDLPLHDGLRPRIFPPEPRSGPRIPAPPRGEGSAAWQLSPAVLAHRRGLLTALSGGALSPLARPDPAPQRDALLALVQRITQGFNLAEYERARALGYEAYLEEQLAPESIDDSATDLRLQNYPSLGMSPKELYDTYGTDFTDPYNHFKGAALLRSCNSKRQLFERMCEFWNDHFSIDHNKGNQEWMFLPEHDRTVIRAHALGSFPTMLRANAFSSAMLYYLDNWLNVRSAPQANYARELLELHTLGVFGGYNESDVVEVAKCFTGWTLNGDPGSPDWMRGTFEQSLHLPGQKFVLGTLLPAFPAVAQPGQKSQRDEARLVLDLVVAHASTAQFLARKLIRWFLTPTPPPDLVQRVATTYLDTQGDIRAMLRVILARPNLAAHSGVLAPKFRRPFHCMTALFRAFDGEVRNPTNSLSFLGMMGHVPFDHGQPNGYPDTVEAWGTALQPRWSFANVLLRPLFGGYIGVAFLTQNELAQRLEYSGPNSRSGLAVRMNERLFGQALSPFEVEALQGYMDTYPLAFDLHGLFDTLALAASLPGFQWY
ncbi:MAG: DUF1800 domain-containing protein [Planctomycetes bacterium]|nr:DUF1800 domain-containing protein [Planctomycetota bacterium]